MEFSKIIDTYLELQKQVFQYFGYKEDWRILPLVDSRQYYWYLTGEGYGDSVVFAETEEKLLAQNNDYYMNDIYTQRFLPKWVYLGEAYTLVVVDTHTDGNQLLRVFSNAKRVWK